MRRRALLTSALVGLAVLIAPRHAEAQAAVVCANCSQLWQQLLQYAKEIKAYETQVQQYITEFNSYLQLVTSGVTLPSQLFAAVTNDIYQVRNIANAASVLTGGTGSLLTRLSIAGGLANSASYLPQNIDAQFTMFSQTFANASTKLGQLFNTQSVQANTSASLQAGIQRHSITAVGQTQAIQAGTEMAGLTNYTLQQMHTTITAAANEATTRDIVAATRQQMQDGQYMDFVAGADFPRTGMRY